MRLSIFIILSTVLASCSTKSDIRYFWVTSTDNFHFDTSLISRIHTDSLPSGSKSINYFSKDTISYFVRPDILNGSQTNRFKNLDYALRLFSDTLITFGKDKLNVFEYIQNENMEDGGIIHCWEKDIGIYAVHSTTRRGLTKIQTSDTSLNKKINFLIKATVPSFFYEKE